MEERPAEPRVRPATVRRSNRSNRLNIADIAALANVSTSAVSYALNGRGGVAESTRQRILDIAAAENWRPNSAARALITERASAVGIVNQYNAATPILSAEFMGRFLVGVQHFLRERDVLLTMHMVDDFEAENRTYQRWLGERRVDGVFLLNPLVDDPRVRELERIGLPAVVIGDARRSSTLISAWTDDAAATELAVDHLVGLGHRSIGWIAGGSRFLHVDIRRRAFQDALARHGLEPDDRIVLADGEEVVGLVRDVARLVRDEVRPLTALIIEDTEISAGAVLRLTAAGVSVPAELSIVAWDDGSKSTLVHPALTVLSRDIEEYGRLAARALMTKIETGESDHVRNTPTELVERESSGPAPQ